MSAWDYVVVGSGAGGGTLAARLAEAGMRVFLLEAGSDPHDAAEGLPEDYDVPGFHPLASENPAMSWEFFVRHYTDDEQQKADWKHRPDPDTGKPSIFYPRAGTLGGCTAHNAMIFMAPHESDWDEIARMTGDVSWQAPKMRRYFRLLENCRHRPLWRLLEKFGLDPSQHGWGGWLPVERAAPAKAFGDDELMRMVIHSAWQVLTGEPRWRVAIRRLLLGEGDPNDYRLLRDRTEGLCYVPLTTDGHRRIGTRERLKDAAARYPGRLKIELDALATKVIFGPDRRAMGVEYLKGRNLYRAHPNPSDAAGERREIRASREVILAGGAFNTPQLLMLSGIGPREVLERNGIEVVEELDGVGQNLQDRYEVAVLNPMVKPWESLKYANFKRGDRLYREWLGGSLCKAVPAAWQRVCRRGMYISNGAAIAFTRRSAANSPDPDLFCMALLAKFAGYYPGYSRDVCEPHERPGHLDYLTFAILKAHTLNRAGSVSLRSNDPRDRPEINFRYFDEGDDGEGRDLKAMVEGIKFVRKITAGLKGEGLIGKEELPGEQVQDDELAQYVRNTAWGHHASCTCPIGPPGRGGVLTSDFKVHGTQGLRVVDASVFPRIPGFFIVSAIYMIAEKAAEVILHEARVNNVRK